MVVISVISDILFKSLKNVIKELVSMVVNYENSFFFNKTHFVIKELVSMVALAKPVITQKSTYTS